MKLLLLGMNHRSAPVDIRERYAVPSERLLQVTEKLVGMSGLDEALLLSTCNRTDLIVASRQPEQAVERMYEFFRSEIGDGTAGDEHLYELSGPEVAEHLFRVGASLDSMVLGEAQITGQLKAAYRAAVAARSVGPVLNRLLQRAFRTAKRVRTETGIGASQISIARVGVQLALEVFEDFSDKRVALLGAGEMAESALVALRDAGAAERVIINRTLETARRLAQRLSASAAPLDALDSELALADIVIVSVAADRPLLDRERLERSMRQRSDRPLLLVDLGLPRNVSTDVNEIDAVYLYDLDDLDGIAARGRAHRLGAVGPAQEIVRHEVDRYERWLSALDAVPVIKELRAHADALARAEVDKQRHQLRGELDGSEAERALEALAHALTGKLLHSPLERLRREAEEGRGDYFTDAARALFDLNEDEE